MAITVLAREERLRLIEEGKTPAEIAEIQGVDEVTIRKWIREQRRKELRQAKRDRRKVADTALVSECEGCLNADKENNVCVIVHEPKYAWTGGKGGSCPAADIPKKKHYSDKIVEKCKGCARVNKDRNICKLLKEPGWHWRGERVCSFRTDDQAWEEKFETARKEYMTCRPKEDEGEDV